MNPIVLGQGVASDVTIVDGHIYVAYGTVPMSCVVVRLTLAGVETGRSIVAYGFDQSFPRFSGPWLVYRQDEAHGFAATAVNILNGLTWVYGAAGATFGLTVNQALGLVAYEWRDGSEPWRIWFGKLTGGAPVKTAIEGAPDGLDQILSPSQVTLRKDTRGDVAGIWYPVRASDLVVGELRDEPSRPQGGIGVQLTGDVLRSALGGVNTPDPRCATDGSTYAIVCWNPVRLLIGTAAELRALPPVGPLYDDKQPGPIVTEENPMPVAPNRLTDIRAIIAAHPEIDTMADGPFAPDRGGITELAAVQFGLPFGRKSKDGSATNLSDDALCYRLADSRFEIYDILSGGDGSATWDYKGTFANGENGWFVVPSGAAPPIEPPVEPPVQPPASGLTEDDVRRIVAEELAKPRNVALRTHDGQHFVCAEGAGGGDVNATRTGDGPWETFTLVPK